MLIPSVNPVFNWRNKKNKKDHYPVHLEIKIDGIRKYYRVPVPLAVTPDQWSGKQDGWVNQNHPYFFEINNKIREKKDVVTGLIKRYYSFGQSLSFDTVFRELKKSANANSFNEYLAEYIRRPSDGVEPDTLKKYKACLIHLNKFNPQVRFYDLTPELVERFYQHMKKTEGLAGSTIDSYFDAFRKVLGLARKDHQISKELEEGLFEDLHIDVRKAKRTYLSIEEIKKWKQCKFSNEEKHLERDRDMFLLQIYTGFYYKDLINFRKEYLVKDHEFGYVILGARDKNDEQTIIPLFKFPDAHCIIEKYASSITDEFVFSRRFLLAEPVYNRHLKEISKKAGLTKTVSNKVICFDWRRWNYY
jgi:site-specific recombinase XerD